MKKTARFGVCCFHLFANTAFDPVGNLIVIERLALDDLGELLKVCERLPAEIGLEGNKNETGRGKRVFEIGLKDLLCRIGSRQLFKLFDDDHSFASHHGECRRQGNDALNIDLAAVDDVKIDRKSVVEG